MIEIDYNEIIENIPELTFYKETHNKILSYLEQNKSATFWEIVKEVQGSDRRVLRLLNQMIKINEILIKDKKIFLVQKNNSLKDKKRLNPKCISCNGRNIVIANGFLKIYNQMKAISKQRPKPTFLFDQRPVTIETTIRRVAYMSLRNDLKEKKIAIIGDDDLTSLAIGLTNEPKEIIVFDIDERLIRFINNFSRKNNLKIRAYRIDLTNKIPSRFIGNFDVFLTDPTPNKSAFSLFFTIGLCLLKPGKERVGYISFFPSHQPINPIFQDIINRNRAIITDMNPKFTEYDFIKETYREEDIQLLEKFDSKEDRISFYENLTRIETCEETTRKIDFVSNKKNFLGKATKKVLANLEKDPAFIAGDKRFVRETAKSIRGALK